MKFKTNLKNIFIILFATLALSACSTAKKSQTAGDVYTGNATVEYLASGVKDRVFFATNKSSLTCLKSNIKKTSYIFTKK